MTTNRSPQTSRLLILAAPRSFCAGVERAIETVQRALHDFGAPVFVRRQIVHNAHVISDLQDQGAVFVDEVDDLPAGSVVVFSAHGVSPGVRAGAHRNQLHVLDATCPLVSKVQVRAMRLTGRGDTVVLIGHAGHEEVEGILGHAPGKIQLVQRIDDVDRVHAPDPSRVSYLTQTTLAVDETKAIVGRLRQRFPQLVDPPSSDICYATTNRQQAVTAIAHRSDLVLVLGSANSSNSLRLVDVAERVGVPAHLIEDAGQISPAWLNGAVSIGISAGASAPPHLVEDVIAHLRQFGPVEVQEVQVARETVRFAPPALRERL